MRSFALSIPLLAMNVLAAGALGDEPDPKEILSKVNQTLRAVKMVSYKVEAWGEDGFKDMLPRVRATVKAKESKDFRIPLLRIEGVMKAPHTAETYPLRAILGEREVIRIETKEKACFVGQLPDGLDLIAPPMQLTYVHKLLHPAPFSVELAAGSLTYEGRQTVAGTPCHVIYVVPPGGGIESRWYFGIDDLLPHRVERILKSAQGRGVHVLELSEIDTTPAFDEETFATRVPEGYERRRYQRAPTADANLLPIGSPAPNWTLKTPQGASVSLAKLRGQVVVLDFWATWCLPCLQAMPTVQRLHEKFKGKRVAVFGVNVWERDRRADPAAFMKQRGLTYGLLLNGGELSQAYRVMGIPTFYVIGPEGKIVYAAAGLNPAREKELVKIIEALLEKND